MIQCNRQASPAYWDAIAGGQISCTSVAVAAPAIRLHPKQFSRIAIHLRDVEDVVRGWYCQESTYLLAIKITNICHTTLRVMIQSRDNVVHGSIHSKETANSILWIEPEKAQTPISVYPNTHPIRLRNHRTGHPKLWFFFPPLHRMSQQMLLTN